jgi:hypothetical protein
MRARVLLEADEADGVEERRTDEAIGKQLHVTAKTVQWLEYESDV